MLIQLRLLVLLWATAAATRVLIPGPATVSLQDTVAQFSGQAVASTSEQECISSSLHNLSRVCLNGVSQSNGTLGDQLTRLLRSCMHSTSAPDAQHQPARILLFNASMLSVIRNATSVYQELTGIPIELDALSPVPFIQARQESLANAADLPHTHEAWLVNAGLVTPSIAAGSFNDLSKLVVLDDRLQWEDILRPVRESALLYKGKVVTLPLSAYSGLLFYRKEVFERYNIPVPHTWRELADTVKKYNGTEGLHGFCGGWSACTNLGAALAKYMLATVHQTQGPTQGWFMDPDSLLNSSSPRYQDLGLMVDSPGAVEVAEILRLLYQYSPTDNSPDFNCGQDASGFLQMSCLMTLSIATTYKYISYLQHAHPLQGKLGIAVIPGSDRVLDRQTNTMVPCDATRCPYANSVSAPNGSSVLVNRSPGFDAMLMATNAHAPPELAFFTFRVVAYLASAQVDDLMMFMPDSFVFPYRYSQLDPKIWANAGYNLQDSQHFCDAHKGALTHDNLHITVRLPFDIVTWLVELSKNITNTTQSIPTIMAHAQQEAQQLLQAQYQGDMQALAADYFAGLNRQLPPMVDAAAASQPSSDDGGNSVHGRNLALAVVLAGLASVAFLFGLWKYRRHLLQQSGNVSHPAPGPLTTLLITDIEKSTQLWEELPDGVMNTAMTLHDSCIRNLAADCHGYESMWEGDSFTIAFHAPQQALEFALTLQIKLLQLPWPTALLANDLTKEIWARPTSTPSIPAKLIAAPAALQHFALKVTASSRQHSDCLPWPSDCWQGVSHKVDSPTHSEAFRQLDASSTILSADTGQPHRPIGDLQLHVAPSYSSTMSSSFSQTAAPPPTPTSGERGSGPQPVSRSSSDSTQRQSSLQHTSSSTYEQQIAGSWVNCEAVANGAQLIFRGLRVRVGLTLGTTVLSYHDVVGRYRYTGPIRALCNAVTNAAHGGQVILNNCTAEALTSLPPHCTTLYMGAYILPEVGSGPTHLVMALPSQLKARLVFSCMALRGSTCYLPGVLKAPYPNPGARPGLAYVQPSGLSILMAWDEPTTLQALAQLHQAVQQQANRWDGFVFEDGLLRLSDSNRPANEPITPDWGCRGAARVNHSKLLISKGGKHKPIASGLIAVAFPDPLRALKFAVCLRLELLHVAWPAQLLSHELCEPLGWDVQNQPSPASSAQEIEVVAATDGLSPILQIPPVGNVGSVISKQPGVDAALELGVARVQVSPVSMKSSGVSGTWYALNAPMLRGLRTRTVLLGRVQDMQPNLQTRGYVRAAYTSKHSKQLGQLFKLARQGQILASADVVAAAGWAMPAIPE